MGLDTKVFEKECLPDEMNVKHSTLQRVIE
jgi:hypothetical protein